MSDVARRRLRALKTRNIKNAVVIWERLQAVGSVRRARPIAWPLPRVVQAPNAAYEQDEFGYVADKHYAAVKLPLAWNVNPFDDKSWQVRLMCLQPMDVYLIEYERSKDPVWVRKAADLFFSWCDFHITKGELAYMSWYDMPCGYRAIKMALLLDYALEGVFVLTEPEACMLIQAAEAHLNELMVPAKLSQGNHGIFQMHGLAILAAMFWPLERARDATDYAADQFNWLVRRQFNEEGLHLEHSPQYHQWMLGELRDICGSGWHRDSFFQSIEARAQEACNWIQFPNRLPVRIGDTAMSQEMPIPIVEPQPDFTNGLYDLKVYPRGGYAVCKGEGFLLFLQASYHSKAHKHADHLHFDWFDKGVSILVDSGSSGYKSGPERAYFLSTRAHNTIEVNGRSFNRDGTDAFGSALVSVTACENGVIFVARHACGGVDHERTLKFWPNRRLEIHDRISAKMQSTFTSWLHLHPSFVGDGAVFSDQAISVSISSNGLRKMFRGRTAPFNGWYATSVGTMTENTALSFTIEGVSAAFETVCALEEFEEPLGNTLWQWGVT